jgi:hypothetical protein
MVQTATQQDNIYITRRLLRSMPASRFEMRTLTRLAGIVATTEVPTASVECKRRPRMLINPQFVADNCPRDEHLFLLVMHELWHVLLAHTRMYPISTRAHNIAFDAIINAGLMNKFSTPEYRGFFDKMYKADEFPYCLLRPPEGWPNNPVYREDVGPAGTKQLMERLYPPFNYHRPRQKPLYEEILKLLLDSGMNLDQLPIVLLGNHGDPLRNPDGSPINDPFMKNAVKQMAENWSPFRIDGRRMGRGLSEWQVDVAPNYDNARRIFSNVLKQTFGRQEGREYRRAKMPVRANGGTGVLLNPRDRQLHARRALGDTSLRYIQPTTIQARVPEKPTMAHMYLDVSGSMRKILPHLVGLLIPYAQRRQVTIFQFSTEVTPLHVTDLQRGQLTTTGGTNIECVLDHIASYEGKVQKVLLLTDGGVGAPPQFLINKMQDLGVNIYAVLPHNTRMNAGSAPLMRSIVQLPPAG